MVTSIQIADEPSMTRGRYREIIGCAVVGGLGIALLDSLVLLPGMYYIGDSWAVLHSVAVHNIMEIPRTQGFFRPLEYWVITAANNIYLPLWLGAALLCVVGATILSALACEKLFERQLPIAAWWVLGAANPLLFYLVTTPGTMSQSLCDFLFAGALLAFVIEMNRLSDRPSSGWRADGTIALLNLTAAALLLTKETAIAAAVLLPAVAALIRVKTHRVSWIFLITLMFPIGAAITWVLIRLQFPLSGYLDPGARYGVKTSAIAWAENFFTTLAFPLTPLPSSFLGFALLRPLWIVSAFGSVALFIGLVVREAPRRSKIVVPLLVVALSCLPMILVHSSELYSSMIAPFAVSIILLFGVSRMRWPSLAFGLLLYAASLGNGIVYSLGTDLNLLGLERLPYSIYGEYNAQHLPCPIATTAHIAWDGTAFVCVR